MNAAMPRSSASCRRLVTPAAVALLALGLPAGSAIAQEAQSFYAGKTIKLIVGLPPGGGADAYARLVQRHLGRHIAGAPAILIQNMPGAGSLRSVMALNAAPEDGSVMAHFSSALLSEAITAPERVRLDFRNYAWLGNVSEDVRVCYLRSASGVRNWPDMLARNEVVFGARSCAIYSV
jgi:tripartite-type tricarboxylate transporter receptor subunit TctC